MNIYLFVKEHTEENKTKRTRFYLPPMEGASLYGDVRDQTLDGFPYTLLKVNYKLLTAGCLGSRLMIFLEYFLEYF
jgi:hypothetical protein